MAFTSETAALAIAKYVAVTALPVLESNLFMARLVNRDYEATLAQAGDTVNVPIVGSMSANNIAENGSVQSQTPALGNIPVTLTSHIEATFSIPDVTAALVNIDLAKSFMQPAMVALSEKVETDLLNLGPLFTFNASVGASNTAPTEAVIDNIETNFFKAKVPTTSAKYCACSADFYASLRQISRFTERRTIGTGDAIMTGEIGELKNIQFFRSQLVTAVSSTTNNLAFTPDAIALVVRRLGLPMAGTGAVGAYAEYKNLAIRVLMSYNPNTLGQQFTVDMLYGCAALRNQFGMQVLS